MNKKAATSKIPKAQKALKHFYFRTLKVGEFHIGDKHTEGRMHGMGALIAFYNKKGTKRFVQRKIDGKIRIYREK